MAKFLKMQVHQENFMNIAEINRKTHGICPKRTRKFLLGYKIRPSYGKRDENKKLG